MSEWSYVTRVLSRGHRLGHGRHVRRTARGQRPGAGPPAGNQAPETVIVVLFAACPAPAGGSAAAASSCPPQAPVLAQLNAVGATVLSSTTLVDTITAKVTPAEAQVLSSYPGVSQVVPDGNIPMPRYLVERTFRDGLHIPMDQSGANACAAVVENNSRHDVAWVHSYVTPDKAKTYCIYDAPTPEAVRQSARVNNLPVDSITEVRVLDPYTARNRR